MMTFRSLVLSAAFLAASAGQSHAQSLSIEDVMTAAQMRLTGVSTLSAEQRAALDEWLNGYTERVVQIAIRPDLKAAAPAGYTGVAAGHWVEKVTNEGRTVELEDGSVWEISATDRIYTGLWQPVTDITVAAARQPVGEYNYSLTNKDGEIARARYVGK